MAMTRKELLANHAEPHSARSPLLWLSVGSAAAMLSFFGWLFVVAFSA